MATRQPKWSFADQIAHNRRQTVLVVGLMGAILFALVFALGLLLDAPPVFTGVGTLLVVGIYLAITWNRSVDLVIRAARARPANPAVREEQLLLHRVEEMAIASGLPTPRVYVQESDGINAFAAGRDPKEAVVCVTTGALRKLDQEELEGVIGHEMSHILNYDVRLATVTVAVVGAIAMLSEIAIRALWFGGGRRGGGRGGGAGPLIIVALVLIVLAPVFSRLVHLMLSRRREYLADATGVRLTRNPEGLARALLKIKGDVAGEPPGSKTVAGLYISNPWRRMDLSSVLSSHPPLDERVARIRRM